VIRVGGRLAEDAPPLPFPLLHAHRKPDRIRKATGEDQRRASPESEPLPLTAIAGIGPAREKQLREAGIDSVQKLAMADPDVVTNALTGVSAENAPHFIEEAKKLLSERPEVAKR
jgi:predicted flap endonuclease-1-like 5' DNA nuclease